jgi:hypothetical protein
LVSVRSRNASHAGNTSGLLGFKWDDLWQIPSDHASVPRTSSAIDLGAVVCTWTTEKTLDLPLERGGKVRLELSRSSQQTQKSSGRVQTVRIPRSSDPQSRHAWLLSSLSPSRTPRGQLRAPHTLHTSVPTPALPVFKMQTPCQLDQPAPLLGSGPRSHSIDLPTKTLEQNQLDFIPPID